MLCVSCLHQASPVMLVVMVGGYAGGYNGGDGGDDGECSYHM